MMGRWGRGGCGDVFRLGVPSDDHQQPKPPQSHPPSPAPPAPPHNNHFISLSAPTPPSERRSSRSHANASPAPASGVLGARRSSSHHRPDVGYERCNHHRQKLPPGRTGGDVDEVDDEYAGDKGAAADARVRLTLRPRRSSAHGGERRVRTERREYLHSARGRPRGCFPDGDGPGGGGRGAKGWGVRGGEEKREHETHRPRFPPLPTNLLQHRAALRAHRTRQHRMVSSHAPARSSALLYPCPRRACLFTSTKVNDCASDKYYFCVVFERFEFFFLGDDPVWAGVSRGRVDALLQAQGGAPAPRRGGPRGAGDEAEGGRCLPHGAQGDRERVLAREQTPKECLFLAGIHSLPAPPSMTQTHPFLVCFFFSHFFFNSETGGAAPSGSEADECRIHIPKSSPARRDVG